MIRVTIAAPVAMIPAANELAACIGFTEADRYTFMGPTHQDANGAQYCVASGPVLPAFVSDAVSPLVEPPWGADMALANAAQAAIAIWTEEAPFLASPLLISAIVSEDVDGSYAALGLTKLPEPEPEPEEPVEAP